MQASCVIGIDLGGTNCRAGVVDSAGNVLTKRVVPIGHARSSSAILQLLGTCVEELRRAHPTVTAVGVGAPGIIDPTIGCIYRAPHFPEWKMFRLREALARICNVPVQLDNDANVVALGECWLGTGKGLSTFLLLTFGTGIGGALVIDGRVHHGDCGFAGEVGHQVMHCDGPPCACGGVGCWELYASASGFHRLLDQPDDPRTKSFLTNMGGSDQLDPAVIYRMACDGNIYAHAVWQKFGTYVGAGIASVVNTTGLFQVVIGGGLAGAWDFFIPEAQRAIHRHTYPETAARIVLHRVRLGEDGGIIGAARLAVTSPP